LLYLAWRASGCDPYATYNGLGRDFRPLGHPELPPRPPRYPSRIRHFIYGLGMAALDTDVKLAGGKQSQKVARAMGG
jgi:hypothetical protein